MIKQAYIDLNNKEENGFKRMNALIYILKHNLGEEKVFFASDISKVKQELSKCLCELLNVRNHFSDNYGTIQTIIFNNNIKSDEEDEKYIKIIQHCGYLILNDGEEIIESDIAILSEYKNRQDMHLFSYENIADFANYAEDMLSLIKTECDGYIGDMRFTKKISKEINDIINKYWDNTVEFDYALLEEETETIIIKNKDFDGVCYFFEEQKIEYWKNELSNVIHKEKKELSINALKTLKQECKRNGKRLLIYLNYIYKFNVTIEDIIQVYNISKNEQDKPIKFIYKR